jgi:tRNA dimethylallyltransferase
MKAFNTLVVLGATATGKTKLAAQLAYCINGEIISADSRQVYAGMDIGTGKDLADYTVNQTQIKHHLISIVQAGSKYHIHQFKTDFIKAFIQINQNRKQPIVCGGSGLYLQACLFQMPFTSIPVNQPLRIQLENYTKEALIKTLADLPPTAYTPFIDATSHKRLIRAIEINNWLQHHTLPAENKNPITPYVIGLRCDREVLKQRIANRLISRIENGLIQEVVQLKDAGLEQQLLYYGLEYKFVLQFILGQFNMQDLLQKLSTAINQFAKRQETFFRKLEKDGLQINWIDVSDENHETFSSAKTLIKPYFNLIR